VNEIPGAPGARGEPAGTDERDSQLSAMFDGELPDSECELLARRLSRDPALQQQWSRYSLIGAVVRNEPLHARRAPGGRVAAGIAARLSSAIEAEAAIEAPAADEASQPAVVAPAGAAGVAQVASGGARWMRPAAGFAIAASVAALSVFWLQGRGPVAVEGLSADAGATPAAVPAGAAPTLPGESAAAGRADEVIAPPAATRGAGAEVVVAGNGYPPANERGPGSGEPESYVVPMPAGRSSGGPPAQLANYVVAHSEFSAPLSRRSLLSALVASEAAAAPPPEGPVAAPAAPGAAPPIVQPEAGAGK
jgi:sigma-E factor negative regulatory protein RseA